jgi:hypothetical protein
VKPGDRIVFKVWVKTGAFANANHSTGARIGIDFYGNSGILDTQPHGYQQVNGVWVSKGDKHWVSGIINSWVAYPNTFNDVPLTDFLLPWGHSEWALLEYDLIVPTRLYNATLPNGVVLPKPETINGVIAWLDCRNVSDNAYAWFADAELYINPEDGGDEEMAKRTFKGIVDAQEKSGETVTLTIKKPDGSTETLQTPTQQDRSFGVTKDLPAGKGYKVKAYIGADAEYEAADSEEVIFDVDLAKRTINLSVS